jgi:RNA polymerase-binding transcription factor DksA
MSAPTLGTTRPNHSFDAVALQQLRAALVADRAAHAALVPEFEARVVELTGHVDVDSILERELAEASAARSRAVIADIDRALIVMDAGQYGVCEACGAPIPVERLEAIPHSRRCVPCAQ